MGFLLAIDDFGTGYSSLSYLQKLPIQVLKIDRSFLPKSESDFGSMALCEAIIGIGSALGKSIVAEGVETYEQRDFLASRDCHVGQGYLFGRPMPAADLASFVGAPGKTQRFLRRVVNG
jgi:EAL domain-containing protein (putative c-di-GMP-specific phosphodiesterase class I)